MALGYGIGGGAFVIGYNGQVLAGNGVDQGRFAGVPAAKQADMGTLPGRVALRDAGIQGPSLGNGFAEH